MYYASPSPGGNSNRLPRSSWLRDRMYETSVGYSLQELTILYFPSFFDGLERDDDFAVKQIGFKASNVFTMQVTS